MKKHSQASALIFSVIFAATLSGCSDDKTEQSATKTQTATAVPATTNAKSPADTKPLKEQDKTKFVHEFAEQCVQRELHNADDKEAARKSAEEPCACIANYLVKDLSAVEIEKYLEEHEDTHAMQISFDSAAYFCLQNKAHPKGPQLFGKK